MKPLPRWLQALPGRFAREPLAPGALFLFLAAGGLLALTPAAAIGGPRTALWGLGAVAIAAALHTGLGGAFSNQGLFRSAWLRACPPGRFGRALAAGLGTWLALGVLLLPALLLAAAAFPGMPGGHRPAIPLAAREFHPGPAGFLATAGAILRVVPEDRRPVWQIRLEPLPHVGLDDSLAPVPLETALDGGPWRHAGTVSPLAPGLEIPVTPPRPLGRIEIRRTENKGVALWFEPDAVRLLGPLRPAWRVWLWAWLSAWNVATGAALCLAAAGGLLSRPVAVLLGAAWAALALADARFLPGFLGPLAAQGLASGPDLAGGRGWLPLAAAGAGLAALSLEASTAPGRESR